MSPTRIITLSKVNHHREEVILIAFAYDPELIETLKQLPGARWSQSLNTWYIPVNEFDLHRLFEALRGKAWVDYSGLKLKPAPAPAQKETAKNYAYRTSTKLPKGYLEMLEQKRYSDSTIRTYCAYFKDFMHHFEGKELKNITAGDVNGYLLGLIKENQISRSQQNQRINAIKFYYEKVLKLEKQYYAIERPRVERKLPDILSKEEIFAMLRATDNLKHKCLIALIYSCGLRRSEAIALKPEDVDSKRMLIKIKGAKGKKDRYVQLAQSTLELMRRYYRKEKPQTWLFEGQRGKQYSATSILKDVKNAALRAGVKKTVYTHILRHSFATHHLEQGTDLRYIQEWLGHESSKTTEIYTHVSNTDFQKFKNPIDDFDPDDS